MPKSSSKPMSRAHVRTLLETHVAADPAETRDLATIHRILRETPASVDLFDKHQTAPGHFTASAIAVTPDRSRVLLIRHPAFGLWLQPGGHTDPADRSLPEAAARELLEETGLGSNHTQLLGLHDVAVHEVPDGSKGQPGHLHLDLRFAFAVAPDAPLRGEDHLRPRWFAVDDLHSVETDASVRAAARRLRLPG